MKEFFLQPMQYIILGQVTISMLLGAIIGIDREIAKKPAGLRTHMFVAGMATLFVSLGETLIQFFEVDPQILRSDPIRIIEAIITGVAFLGAGTIIRSSPRGVQGLTTAASLLLSAGLGICVALNQYILAVGIVLIAIVVLRLFVAFGFKSFGKTEPREEE